MALSIYLPKAITMTCRHLWHGAAFIAHSDLQLQSRLSELVRELAKQSPGEVAYLLKEVLADTEGAEIEQRLRSYLDYFEPRYAQSIQDAIKNHAKR